MSVKRALVALIMPTLLTASACSSGTEQHAQSLSGDETTGEVSSAIGENSCAYAGSNAGYSFASSIADPGFVTDADYTNPKCYKAWIAEVDNWASFHQDLVVADATIDSASWHPPQPPRTGPPLQVPPLNGRDFSIGHPVFPIGQAECESLSLKAMLYENGKLIGTRSAVGQWVPFGLIGTCARPWVRFGNTSQRNTDVDWLEPGREYKVAATLRSGTSTRALKLLTPTTVCGADGGACCPDGAAVNHCDAPGDSCQSGTCHPCGHAGQPACPQSDGSVLCTPVNESLTLLNGICTSCGGQDLACCDPRVSDLPFACGGAMTCQNGRCEPPVVVQPPNPSWDPNCGNQYHQCCPAESHKGACKLAQACFKGGAFLSAGDDLSKGICDNPGPSNNCVYSATAVIDDCSGGSNILHGESLQGCGATPEAAQTAAVIGFGYNNICIDNNNSNCCTYHFL